MRANCVLEHENRTYQTLDVGDFLTLLEIIFFGPHAIYRFWHVIMTNVVQLHVSPRSLLNSLDAVQLGTSMFFLPLLRASSSGLSPVQADKPWYNCFIPPLSDKPWYNYFIPLSST